MQVNPNSPHQHCGESERKKGLWSRLKKRFHAKPNTEDIETLFPGLFGRALSGGNASGSGNGTLIASLPQRIDEQRRLATSLLAELDEYERLQNRGGSMYRNLPPLRFHVRVVRNVNGQTQRIHNVLNAAQLREKLAQVLNTTDGHQSQNLFADLIAPSNPPVKRCVENIEAFPSYKYDGSHLPEEKNMCVVCQAEYEKDEEIRVIPCLHFFHKECIDQWMMRSCVCPICKSKIEG